MYPSGTGRDAKRVWGSRALLSYPLGKVELWTGAVVTHRVIHRETGVVL